MSDWPLLNALLNTASGATWVSLHHGGGVGMGFSQHAGMVIVADGTPEAARRLERVLWNDPATGVMRHADAGYDDRAATAPARRACGCPASADGAPERGGRRRGQATETRIICQESGGRRADRPPSATVAPSPARGETRIGSCIVLTALRSGCVIT